MIVDICDLTRGLSDLIETTSYIRIVNQTITLNQIINKSSNKQINHTLSLVQNNLVIKAKSQQMRSTILPLQSFSLNHIANRHITHTLAMTHFIKQHKHIQVTLRSFNAIYPLPIPIEIISHPYAELANETYGNITYEKLAKRHSSMHYFTLLFDEALNEQFLSYYYKSPLTIQIHNDLWQGYITTFTNNSLSLEAHLIGVI